MNREELINEYINYFKNKNHVEVKSASLIPENDPTVLFTTAGMHPLVPFLLGQPHPSGKRLVNNQKCIRTGDIESVGDGFHLTFFEMLGNWSLGDYWKKESIEMCYDFLINVLNIDKEKLSVTIFGGEREVPKDEESEKHWLSLGLDKNKIIPLSRKDNWWGPVGEVGPCGPDTEMFIDTKKEECSSDCKPGCSCGKYFEVWNSVFMEYNKTKEGKFLPLKQKNVDTGMGVERTVAMMLGNSSVYDIPSIKKIKDRVSELINEKNEKSERIITDHLRTSVFILSEDITPSNIDQGYILRRLIRRAIRHGKLLGINKNFCSDVTKVVIDVYKDSYPILKEKEDFILREIEKEENRFNNTLQTGNKKFDFMVEKNKKINKEDAFLLFQSYGFPIEMTVELAKEKDVEVDVDGFYEEYQKHQEISRKGAEKKFKGGLVDASEETKKLHTAAHLVAEALRRVLGREIVQKGSNITPERLRFDFNFDRKLTEEEIEQIEDMVNEQIKKGLSVTKEEMDYQEAINSGAQGQFTEKYGDRVFVYYVGDFSKEICGGPHVENIKNLGTIKITKQKSVAAGVRRIKAILK